MEPESTELDSDIITNDVVSSDSLSPVYTSTSSDDDSVLPSLPVESDSMSDTSISDSASTVCNEMLPASNNVALVTVNIHRLSILLAIS